MKAKRFRAYTRGFTLVEIMIVVTILGLLIGLAFPNFLKSRTRARQQLCIENLSQFESAKQIWGVENGKKDGDTPTFGDIIGPASYMKKQPDCPAGGSYELQAIGVNATCTEPGHSL